MSPLVMVKMEDAKFCSVEICVIGWLKDGLQGRALYSSSDWSIYLFRMEFWVMIILLSIFLFHQGFSPTIARVTMSIGEIGWISPLFCWYIFTYAAFCIY